MDRNSIKNYFLKQPAEVNPKNFSNNVNRFASNTVTSPLINTPLTLSQPNSLQQSIDNRNLLNKFNMDGDGDDLFVDWNFNASSPGQTIINSPISESQSKNVLPENPNIGVSSVSESKSNNPLNSTVTVNTLNAVEGRDKDSDKDKYKNNDMEKETKTIIIDEDAKEEEEEEEEDGEVQILVQGEGEGEFEIKQDEESEEEEEEEDVDNDKDGEGRAQLNNSIVGVQNGEMKTPLLPPNKKEGLIRIIQCLLRFNEIISENPSVEYDFIQMKELIDIKMGLVYEDESNLLLTAFRNVSNL